ncbi:hypothetical protein VU07_01930 [Desulfobulbus sp. F4]|nr:hypothetical protein [Desulfobulbus sp. F4]
MSTVQWRPEVNALTTPRSYRARPVAKDSYGYDSLAERIAQKNPLWSADMIKSVLLAEREEIKEVLIEGSQTSLEDAFTWHLSISARLDTPDAPLSQDKDIVNVQVYASRTFVEEVRQAVRLERLPMTEKIPVVSSAGDTVLMLADVLNPAGLLRLTGTDLLLNPKADGCECVLEGTRSGRTVQTRFGTISNIELSFLPDIPVQASSWNNEYLLTITTRYTENGSLRTSSYRRRLRTPLTVPNLGTANAPETGILTDRSDLPYVLVTGGSLSMDEMVRIQAVVLDMQAGTLAFSLLDMAEGGRAGAAVTVAANGAYVLPGFAGSALSSLNVTVSNHAGLLKMVRDGYAGRLVDVLDARRGV